MTHPPAPWHLQGFAYQTLHLVDSERIRPQVPSQLDIVPLFPGKTLGGVYVASYGVGSTLSYNELIVISGLVHYSGQVGCWISHIYVDHPSSVAGGREIWGLPKEYAQFDWRTDSLPSVTVRQGTETLCHLRCPWQIWGWRQGITVPVFSFRKPTLLRFNGQGSCTPRLAGIELEIPAESAFAGLELGPVWLGFFCEGLKLTAQPPTVVQPSTAASHLSWE